MNRLITLRIHCIKRQRRKDIERERETERK